MIRKNNELLVEVKKAMRDGPGEIIQTHIASKEDMFENARMYSNLHF